jgi:hypothetical protein
VRRSDADGDVAVIVDVTSDCRFMERFVRQRYMIESQDDLNATQRTY